MNRAGQVRNRNAGYAMAALLVAIAVMSIAMTVALTAWRQAAQREKEAELVFRGQQYVRALQLFQRKYAAAYPPNLDVLVSQKFLRKKYTDPMTDDGEFEVLYQGSLVTLNPGQVPGTGQLGQTPSQLSGRLTFDSRSGAITQGSSADRAFGGVVGRAGPRGGVIGVRSKSTAESFRIYNGATHYNEWLFVLIPAATGRGQARPGMSPGGGRGFPGGMGGRQGGPGGPRGGGGMGPRGGRGFER